MDNLLTVTASEAREDLYNLVRQASKGLRSFEIRLRGVDPVIMVSKSELDSWLETLDVLASPNEVKIIKSARKEKKLIPHQKALKELGLV